MKKKEKAENMNRKDRKLVADVNKKRVQNIYNRRDSPQKNTDRNKDTRTSQYTQDYNTLKNVH